MHTLRLLFRNSQILYVDGRYIIVEFFEQGDCYMAAATTKEISVWNCYGSTKEAAREMALFKLKQVTKEAKEQELVVKGDGYALYREK
jgi:hypothetical protein